MKIDIEIWPSYIAIQQYRTKIGFTKSNNLLIDQSFYTFNGNNSLLKILCNKNVYVLKEKLLSELAGSMLVLRLLNNLSYQDTYFAGLAKGNYLPIYLWRFFVQIRAIGINSKNLNELSTHLKNKTGSSLKYLTKLLVFYEQTIFFLGLIDQANLFSWLSSELIAGRIPAVASNWRKIIVRKVIWLKPLDLHLLKILSNFFPIRIEFALLKPTYNYSLFILFKKVINYLKSGSNNEIEIIWEKELKNKKKIIITSCNFKKNNQFSMLINKKQNFLKIWSATSYYTEVESLVRRAKELVISGVPHHKIAIIFPKLDFRSRIAINIATRLGLSINYPQGYTLESLPLVQAFLSLLELPLKRFERITLAQVWMSPYLGPALARFFTPRLGTKIVQHLIQYIAPNTSNLLRQACYIDARENSTYDYLVNAAIKFKKKRIRLALEELGLACAVLSEWLSGIEKVNTFVEYVYLVEKILSELKINIALFSLPRPFLNLSNCPTPTTLLLRDLHTWQILTTTLKKLVKTVNQIRFNEKSTPFQLLTYLRTILANEYLSPSNIGEQGVSILSLKDAQGCSLHTALIGGLTQNEFPERPILHYLLSNSEKLALMQQAKLPLFWLNNKEEIDVQIMQLLFILNQTYGEVILSYSIFDAQGRQKNSASIINELANFFNLNLSKSSIGICANETSLAKISDHQTLLNNLSTLLIKPRYEKPQDYDLSQAVLWLYIQIPGQIIRWQDLALRAQFEENNVFLISLSDQKDNNQKKFDSRYNFKSQTLLLLQKILLNPYYRKISSSWLEEYAKCPQAWFYSRLLRLAPLRLPSWELTHDQEGNLIHKVLALFFSPDSFNKQISPVEINKRLKFCLDKAWIDLEKLGLAGHKLLKDARQSLLTITLNKLIQREIIDLENFRPIAVEEWLDSKETGIALVIDKGPPLIIIGRLDRRDINPEGIMQVVEYKHTKKKITFIQPLKYSDFSTISSQIFFYLIGILAKEYFASKIQSRLVPTYLLDDKVKKNCYEINDDFLSTDFKNRYLLAQNAKPNFLNLIEDIWKRIQAGDLTPQPNKNHCRYCNFRKLCRNNSF